MKENEKDVDSENIYMTLEDIGTSNNQSEVNNSIYHIIAARSPGCVSASEERRVCTAKAAAVGLGLLCVLLLAVIIGLCVKHNAERDHLRNIYYNMSMNRDELRSSCYNVTADRDRFKQGFYSLSMERDQLLARYNNLSSSKDQLQTSYESLVMERDDLKRTLSEIMCPSGWTRLKFGCYLISTLKDTWEQSRQFCRERGADLVIINSREEQSFISHLGKTLWIGLSDHTFEGHWTWVDGTVLKTAYWRFGEPNNVRYLDGDEDCVHVVSSASFDLSTWNDINCNHQHFGICEKPL